MIRQFIKPPGFVTFVLHRIVYPPKILQRDVYGFNSKDCQGECIIHGLEYIHRNFDKSFRVSNFETSYLNVNGENVDANIKKMEDTNVIFPIAGTPMFNDFIKLENDEYEISVDHMNVVRYRTRNIHVCA